MRDQTCVAIVIAIVMMVMCAGSSRADNFGGGQDGGWKVSLDSLPMFGDSKDEETSGSSGQEYAEPTEYTYDATGRKVPVSTERSGTARPVH